MWQVFIIWLPDTYWRPLVYANICCNPNAMQMDVRMFSHIANLRRLSCICFGHIYINMCIFHVWRLATMHPNEQLWFYMMLNTIQKNRYHRKVERALLRCVLMSVIRTVKSGNQIKSLDNKIIKWYVLCQHKKDKIQKHILCVLTFLWN